VGRTGQEMERRGHSADPAQLALLGMGMGALALVAFAAFALTGSLSERSPSEIARQVTKTEQDRDVRCKVGGEDSLGDRIWKCGQTLTADGGTPKDIIGERITSCYGLTESRNLDSLTEQPCDRLDPATGGKPK